MTQLAVFVLLCAVLGYALSANNYDVWSLLIYITVGAATLQISYLITCIVHF